MIARRLYSHQAFVQDYAKQHVPLTSMQRVLLTAGSGLVSFLNPYRGDMIACFGETTGDKALEHCLERMLSTDEGSLILAQRPRINTRTVDLSILRKLPDGTVGKTYADFLDINKLSPDDRPLVHYIDDIDLAYVMQRYREVHDIFHATLLMPITMLGEVSIKWFEALQLRLPMCVTGAMFGAFRLRPKQRQLYMNHYLPWAIKNGRNAQFLLGVYFEKRWEQPLDEFHKEMNITKLE